MRPTAASWPRRLRAAALALLAAAAPAGVSGEERSAADEIARYRQMLEDGNPAELVEMRGAELWTTARGPRNASLEACDLGLGPGVVEGAHARLPRWFADTGRVEDLDSRLVTCITTLQGIPRAEAVRGWHRAGSDLEALVTFVASRSRGQMLQAPVAHPAEAAMVAAGEALFHRRAGPLDFSCATCHAQDDRRIRLQDLPNFDNAASARASLATWPAYRVSQSAVWSMERRLIDCIRQMRWPEPEFGSEAIVALQAYLHRQAAGATLQAPGIKR